MKRNLLRIVIGAVVIIFVFSTGVWTGLSFNYFRDHFQNWQESITGRDYNNSNNETEEKYVESFEKTFDLISDNSLEEVEKQVLLQAAIEGMLLVLDDKYAEYFTAEEYKKIMDSYSGTMSGIGVVVTLDDKGRVIIVRVLEDTPASETDIRQGDIITGVDGADISDMELEKIVAMIKGEEGTTVSLEIYRTSDDSSFEVDVTRARFDIPNLISDVFEEEIGYIWYYDFQLSGVEHLDNEIQKMVNSGIKGLILDLRNNPGGAWDDAIGVCDLFLGEGKIVSVKGRLNDRERIDEYFAEEGEYTEIPLIVLINEFSASASELVAGALKDNDRAILIGESSHGKGAVQALYELPDGSGIKLTTAKYFLPSGISVEKVGVRPDIVVKMELDTEEDIQLNRAIEEMKALISEIK